jgi:hypothetical protein
MIEWEVCGMLEGSATQFRTATLQIMIVTRLESE